MSNPKTDYAYCAGLVDGEGCISITKAKNDRKAGWEFQLKISVGMNSHRAVNKLLGVFGGHIYLRERSIGRYKQFVWNIYGKKACEVLRKLKPYLQEKKEQADLGIHFNVYISHPPHRTNALNEQEFAKRDKYYWRMRELKREFLVPKDNPLIALAETKCGNTQTLSEAIVQSS